jgi:hypothetical protein
LGGGWDTLERPSEKAGFIMELRKVALVGKDSKGSKRSGRLAEVDGKLSHLLPVIAVRIIAINKNSNSYYLLKVYFVLVFVVLGFELRASCLCCTT